MMLQTATHEFRSSQFTWTKSTKTFSAEASSLGLEPGQFPTLIDMVSAKTGCTVRFRNAEAFNDASGEDVQGWRYQDLAYGCTILIFND